MIRWILTACFFITVIGLANQSQFGALEKEFEKADKVTAKDILHSDATIVGKCIYKGTRMEGTGKYRYHDSGSRYRAATKVEVTRPVGFYRKDGGLLQLGEHGSAVKAAFKFNEDENVFFDSEQLDAAKAACNAQMETPPRGFYTDSNFREDGLFTTQRQRAVFLFIEDLASFYEYGFLVKSSTLNTKNRFFVMQQNCKHGVCPGSYGVNPRSYGTGDIIRLCVMLDSGEKNIQETIDEAINTLH